MAPIKGIPLQLLSLLSVRVQPHGAFLASRFAFTESAGFPGAPTCPVLMQFLLVSSCVPSSSLLGRGKDTAYEQHIHGRDAVMETDASPLPRGGGFARACSHD